MVVNGARISLAVGLGQRCSSRASSACPSGSSPASGAASSTTCSCASSTSSSPSRSCSSSSSRRASSAQGEVLVDHRHLRAALVAAHRAPRAGLVPVPARAGLRGRGTRRGRGPHLRIAFRHILPNALGPVIVAMTLLMAANIILEAFVSYLNFGISETQVELGQLALQRAGRADPGQLVVGVLPGHGHRAHGHRHQLHG